MSRNSANMLAFFLLSDDNLSPLFCSFTNAAKLWLEICRCHHKSAYYKHSLMLQRHTTPFIHTAHCALGSHLVHKLAALEWCQIPSETLWNFVRIPNNETKLDKQDQCASLWLHASLSSFFSLHFGSSLSRVYGVFFTSQISIQYNSISRLCCSTIERFQTHEKKGERQSSSSTITEEASKNKSDNREHEAGIQRNLI